MDMDDGTLSRYSPALLRRGSGPKDSSWNEKYNLIEIPVTFCPFFRLYFIEGEIPFAGLSKIKYKGVFYMKHTKKLLALLLVLLLAFGLAMPATAAVNWDEFKITKQPQGLTIKEGESFTLSVEVNVPAGLEVEYQWRRGSTFIKNATSPQLHLSPDHPMYPPDGRLGGVEVSYDCWITAYEKDNVGIVLKTDRIWTDIARVKTERSTWGKILDVTIAPFGYAFTLTMLSPAMILIFPFAYIYFLILSYVEGFRALFS